MRKNLSTEKQKLEQELAQYISEIEEQKQEITEEIDVYRSSLKSKYKQSVKAINMSKTGILILGGLYVVYWLGSMVLGFGKSDEPEEVSRKQVVIKEPKDSPIVRQIKSSIASFLLSIAKKELVRLIDKWREKKG